MGDKGKCLVTGVSGFVGLHTAKALVDAGYAVRGTVRSVERHKDALLAVVPSLELVEVDLDSTAEDWVKAADGCTTCCHVASPFPVVAPKDENELIKPVSFLLHVLLLDRLGSLFTRLTHPGCRRNYKSAGGMQSCWNESGRRHVVRCRDCDWSSSDQKIILCRGLVSG